MDGLPKIPVWVWLVAGAAVVVLALVTRSRGGGGAVAAIGTPPSDAALQGVQDTEQANISARQQGFSTLANAIAGVATANTIAGRDIAVTSLSTQAASYGAAVDSVTRQSEQAYNYYGVLAHEAGDTSRTQINAQRDVTLGGIASSLARFLGITDAETQRLGITRNAETAQFIAGQETARTLDTNRSTLALGMNTNSTNLGIARTQSDAARDIAKITTPQHHWYDPLLKGVGAAIPFLV